MGRSRLLASLESRIAALGSAVLTGPSGIGKTALLDTLHATAVARGELVLRAYGTQTERWMPYAGLAELLAQLPRERLAELPQPQRSTLQDVLRHGRRSPRAEAGFEGQPEPEGQREPGARDPSDRKPGGRDPSDRDPSDRRPLDEQREPDQRHLGSVCRLAWRELLGRCATSVPVLLLVDDAQWLDAGTVGAFRYATRRLTGLGVRAVTAGRWSPSVAGETGDDIGGTPWAPTPSAVQLTVPPLAPDEIAELFESHGLTARVANTVHADSGGNPYLALALGGAFRDRVPRHWRPAPLPQRVHSMITERLRTLPARARETLLTAALATHPTVDLLRRAGRGDAGHDIRLAATTGLLVSEGDGIRFTPPAVGTVLAERADSAHRAEIHTALAGVVPDAAGRARHRALATAGSEAGAGETGVAGAGTATGMAPSLVTAAENAARRGSHRMAAELYLLAADRATAAEANQRVEWLTTAAEAGASASLPAIVHRATDAVLASDASSAQRVRVRVALIDLSGQGLSEMDEVFAAALVDAEGEPSLMAPLRLRMAWSAMAVGRPGRGEREADSAVAHARAAGDTTTEAMALASKASVARIVGRDDDEAILRQALRLPEPPLNGWLHATPRFLAARFALFGDRLHEARTDLLRMLALVERGSGEEVVHLLRALAEVSVRMGRCRDALDFADRAIRIAEEAALSPGPAWWDAAVAELAGGSVNRALGYAERGLRASEQERDALYTGRHLHVLGQARLRTGDVRGGVAALRRVSALERDQGVSSPLAFRWHGDLATGLAALGELEQAENLIAAARATVGDRARGVGVTGQLDRAEAAVRAGRGEPETALELLRGAAHVFEELGQPLEVGQCLLEQARVERRRRRHAAARTAVDEALAIFTRCDARPWAEQAGRSLARMNAGGTGGGTGAAAGGTDSASGDGPVPLAAGNAPRVLTDSEERIAALVGEGATNQEVASRMYLSVKTIEAALTRIYRKLGIRSRTQLGSRLRGASGASLGPGASEAR